jgi:transposase-like protein
MFQELYKYGIEAMLKAELDEYLDQEKHQDDTVINYRNGSSYKTVKSSIGDLALNIPRDENTAFLRCLLSNIPE